MSQINPNENSDKYRYVKNITDDKTGRSYHYFYYDDCPRVRLPDDLGSAEFLRAYRAAFASRFTPISVSRRDMFWRFCIRAAARARSISGVVPHPLMAYDIDKLLVDQNWRCAISGIEFDAPPENGGRCLPFTPSLDRINAGDQYEVGNVRVVCAIVNFAMNEWGEDALRKLVNAMSGK